MSNLIFDLRQLQSNGRTSSLRCLAMEAADEIERLTAEASTYYLRGMTRAAEIVEARGREVKGAVDPKITAAAIRAEASAGEVGEVGEVGECVSSDLRDYGYASGGYVMRCRMCKEETWNVDKRAIHCLECATKLRDRAIKEG